MNTLTKKTLLKTETTTRLAGLCLALLLVLPVLSARAEPDPAGKRLRIVYSNDILGEIAACGSCNPQYRKGGLAKKTTGVKRLREGDAPFLILDAGNQFFKFPGRPDTEASARTLRIRAEGIATAHKKMGLVACGVGVNDLAAGPEFLQGLGDAAPPLLSANLVDNASGRRLFPASLTARAGGLTIGIVALTGTHGGQNASWRALPWRDALPEALAELESGENRPDLLILLSNNPLSENRKIAEAFPQLDLIFQSGFAMGNLPAIGATNALINQTEIRGRYLGVLDIDWRGRGPWRSVQSDPRDDKKTDADEQARTNEGEESGKTKGKKGVAVGKSFYNQRFIALDRTVADDADMERFTRGLEARSKAVPPKTAQ